MCHWCLAWGWGVWESVSARTLIKYSQNAKGRGIESHEKDSALPYCRVKGWVITSGLELRLTWLLGTGSPASHPLAAA
ncbi:hypothetical protein BGZ63DRAFT_190940 [Mariannaea sp. PMI_226]|nr:hypothetical protein BGZ63DRAFT_190940 [Mariannaea sp. PMI_226]